MAFGETMRNEIKRGDIGINNLHCVPLVGCPLCSAGWSHAIVLAQQWAGCDGLSDHHEVELNSPSLPHILWRLSVPPDV